MLCIQAAKYMSSLCMHGSRWGNGDSDSPLKNHKNIGFLNNTGLDPLKSHKVTKPDFNVGPSLAG